MVGKMGVAAAVVVEMVEDELAVVVGYAVEVL